MQRCNVIPFTNRGPIKTNLKREHIARAGFRPSIEVVQDDGGSEWVLVEALLTRKSLEKVFPAFWIALDE